MKYIIFFLFQKAYQLLSFLSSVLYNSAARSARHLSVSRSSRRCPPSPPLSLSSCLSTSPFTLLYFPFSLPSIRAPEATSPSLPPFAPLVSPLGPCFSRVSISVPSLSFSNSFFFSFPLLLLGVSCSFFLCDFSGHKEEIFSIFSVFSFEFVGVRGSLGRRWGFEAFGFFEMVLGPEEAKLAAWEGSKEGIGKNKRRKKTRGGGNNNTKGEETTGCWMKFRLMGGCVPSRAKVDNSISSATTHCGNS